MNQKSTFLTKSLNDIFFYTFITPFPLENKRKMFKYLILLENKNAFFFIEKRKKNP